MIRKEDLQSVILDQRQNLEAENRFITRKQLNTIDPDSPQALVITGVRRCGKTTLLKELAQSLPGYYYLTFEDVRLTPFEATDFIKTEEVFQEEFGKCDYLLFDEIQNVPGWEIYIRQKLDQKRHVIISGSNARLLSRELGTHLTGRHLDFELFPFSYQEYLVFENTTAGLSSFQKYLTLGGFPEFLISHKKDYLQQLLIDVLMRDIAVKHAVRNVKVLKEMTVFLLSNIGKDYSYHSIRRVFSLGAVTTVIDYISFLEESYLLFSIPKFDHSLKNQSVNPKKIYAVDNGLALANSLSFSSDTGRMLENLVFLMLRRRYKEIYYFRDTRECDFIVRESGTVTMAVQVCAQLTHDNKDRELEGLKNAMLFFDLPEGLLLTMNEDDKIIIGDRTITIKPVWKWNC
ncbi:MAG: ATP-binding protein [Alphaproteobacteria bacterium]|nr:ATP-binding protein [Alphaproteobacteria bacterium]